MAKKKKKSKPKGNNYENKIATKIRRNLVPTEFDDKTGHNLVHRTPLSGGHVEKGDIIMKPPILQQFPWFIECRNRESWSWKNVMEKGSKSLIGKWFMEDAIEKCHAYDFDAEYKRFPLLVFTKNFEEDYFCARFEDLAFLHPGTFTREVDAMQIFSPTLWIDGLWVMGKFDTLLEISRPFHTDMTAEINKYLGESNES